MREIIKKYEISEDINIYKLEKNNFRRIEPTEENNLLRYIYKKSLPEDLCLYVEVKITKDNKYVFDEETTVEIIDESFGQPYGAFYNEDKDFPFLNDIIRKYNEIMDSLVEKGILQEKKLKKTKKLINEM